MAASVPVEETLRAGLCWWHPESDRAAMPRQKKLIRAADLSCLNRQMTERHQRRATMTRHLALPTDLSLSVVRSVLNRASPSRWLRRFCRSTHRRRDAPSVHPLCHCYEDVARALDVIEAPIHLG